MTLGASVVSKVTPPAGIESNSVVSLTELTSDWAVVNAAPGTAESPSPILNPSGMSANVHPLTINGVASKIQLRLRYKTSSATDADTVRVQAFGLDSAGVPQRLFDTTASPAHVQTLTVAKATDAQDGTYAYSEAVELELQCSTQVLVGINQIIAHGAADCAIMARVK